MSAHGTSIHAGTTRRTGYDVDANGVVLSKDVDSGDDGVVDERHHFAYDARGNLVEEAVDHGGDGTPDWVNGYVYDAWDRPLVETVDTGADGVDRWTAHAYDGSCGRAAASGGCADH